MADTPIAPTPAPLLKPLTSAGILELLYSKARGSLTAQELRQVADSAAEIAERTATHQARLAGMLGCLFMSGADHPAGDGHAKSPREVAELLFMLQGQSELIAGMVHVSQEAEFRAAQP